MRKWSIEKFGNVDLIHFVAMVTKHNMKSQPELLRAMDSYVNVDTSLQENFNEENVILEAAQSHKVQVHQIIAASLSQITINCSTHKFFPSLNFRRS